MNHQSVILRDTHDALGSRQLSASLAADGTLTFEGQDIGKGVEQVFGDGNIEYEWVWTVQPEHVPQLRFALNAGDDVLSALAARFSDDAAAELYAFLNDHKIPYDSWSRIGG
jgi:hypothetical protein